MPTQDYKTPKLLALWDQMQATFKEIFFEMKAINDAKEADGIATSDAGAIPDWFYQICHHVAATNPKEEL